MGRKEKRRGGGDSQEKGRERVHGRIRERGDGV